ncbi:organic cation transporter protein-like [Lineus longissimus]|uniref:organic cation transporter protein-like n=1 Tax=Lineus longissimus TaxID=88925 RepID=UPI00315DD791
MDFDAILKHLGSFGKYQIILYCCMGWQSICVAMMNLSAVFFFYAPDFRCAIPGLENDTFDVVDAHHESLINATIPPGETCKIYSAGGKGVNQTMEPCSSWVYDRSLFTSTAVTDFDLVCNQEIFSSVVTMAYMFGFLCGGFIGGALTDRFGRLTVLVIGTFLQGAAAVGFALSVNVYMLIAFRFLMGLFSMPAYAAAFVYAMEIVGPDRRTDVGLGIGIFYAFGTVFVTPLAYFIRNWVYLVIALTVPCLLIVPYWCLLPDSPRWLIAKGYKEAAVKFVKKAAKVNKKIVPEKLLQDDETDFKTIEDVPKGSIIEVFKNGSLLRRTAIVFFNWGAAAIGYYGLSLNSGNLVGDIFVNFLVQGAIEIPAILFAMFTLDRIGRKGPHVFSIMLCGVSCLATIPVVFFADQSLNWLLVVLSNVGKLGVTAAFSIIYVYTAELYHTTVRSASIGVCAIGARVFSMAAPYIADLGKLIGGKYAQLLPLVIFGSAAIIAGFLACFLPETMGNDLPDTLEDALNLGKKSKKKGRKKEDQIPADNPGFVTNGDISLEMKEKKC